MKPLILRVIYAQVFTAILATTFLLSGCGGGDEPAPPTKAEQVTTLLTTDGGTWTPAVSSGVTIDGVDVTDELFAGFSLTFHESTFTTTGTSPVWLREDTWRFKDENADVIIRGQDDKEITIREISATQLKLTLEWTVTTTEGGREGSLKGKHEFILNK
jgi:hypothetical protein